MKQHIARFIRQIIGPFQTAKTSAFIHNSQFDNPSKYDEEFFLREIFRLENHFNHPETRFDDLLELCKVDIGVDIGSGTGWATEALAKRLYRVIAIEPSSKAMVMARQFIKNPNIVWYHGMAQDVIPTLILPSPTVFISAAVLSHLPDESVIQICDAINAVAPDKSTLGFAECWGDTYHEWMWHVRSRYWWEDQFPGWELDFFGPTIEGKENRHKGFHGFKK